LSKYQEEFDILKNNKVTGPQLKDMTKDQAVALSIKTTRWVIIEKKFKENAETIN